MARQRTTGGLTIAKPFVTVKKECVYRPEVGLDLGAWGYRLTFDLDIPEQPAYLEDCLKAGLETCLSVDTNTFRRIPWDRVREDPLDDDLYLDQVERAIQILQERYDGLCTYVHAWNEFNDPGTEGSRMPAVVVNNVTRLFADYFPNARLIAASDVRGDPESFAALDLSRTSMLAVDLYDSSPAGWSDARSGYIADKIQAYRDRWPWLKLCVMEIGQSSLEAPEGEDGESYQSDYVADTTKELCQHEGIEFFGVYAVQDWRGFGLIRDDGSLKPSYYWFRHGARFATGEHLPPTPKATPEFEDDGELDPGPDFVFAGGFARVAAKFPEVVGNPIENEETIVEGCLADQRTDRGQLVWALLWNGISVYTFTDQSSGFRSRWLEKDLE